MAQCAAYSQMSLGGSLYSRHAVYCLNYVQCEMFVTSKSSDYDYVPLNSSFFHGKFSVLSFLAMFIFVFQTGYQMCYEKNCQTF